MTRQTQILKVIQNIPGIHVRGLMKETGLENGVITYHLRKMEERGIIKSQRRPKYRRYYPVDVSEEQYSIIRNMRKPTKKDIMFDIIIKGNPTFNELVKKTKQKSLNGILEHF